jgi:hypothetical protein
MRAGSKGSRDYISMARDHLLQTKAFAMVDPYWYETMLWIGIYTQWRGDDFDALLNEALAREPGFYPTYFAAMSYRLPSWQRDSAAVEQFARSAAERTRTTDGSGMYGRIYWYAADTQYGERLFKDPRLLWPRMRQGLEDVAARYPDSWNLNNFARFACLAGDKDKLRELWRNAAAQMDPVNWESRPLYDRCKQLATN